MALHPNDLFVIQSQDDSELYKLKLSDLDVYLEGSSGIQFRGTVDLNNGAIAITSSANGDLYIVKLMQLRLMRLDYGRRCWSRHG